MVMEARKPQSWRPGKLGGVITFKAEELGPDGVSPSSRAGAVR